MTVGFKTDSSNDSRFFNKTGSSYKVLKMDLTKISDVQEVDYY